jgi:hypothetical protein
MIAHETGVIGGVIMAKVNLCWTNLLWENVGYVNADAYGPYPPPLQNTYMHFWTLNIYSVWVGHTASTFGVTILFM